ncbi:MAG: homoprotocatechuate degradation operon regulator HpaR [Acidimicrobiia bacterium]|nr:homoprotocatechuate degradation operon regulator HpaR [Acidimicrobiia bacterium]
MTSSLAGTDGASPGSVISMRPFDESLPMALLRARETAMQLFRPLLAEHDLTEQQWRVLRALSAATEPVDASALAGGTFLLAPSLSRILANLEHRGLVVRSTAPDDQRRSLIALTDDGRQLVALVAPDSERTYQRIEQAFGRRRLQRLLAELHDLARLDVDVVGRS